MIKNIGQKFGDKIIKSPMDLAHGEIGIDKAKGKAYIKIGDKVEEIVIGTNMQEAIKELLGRLSIIREVHTVKPSDFIVPKCRPIKKPRCHVPEYHHVPIKEEYVIDQALRSGYTDSIWISNRWGIEAIREVFWLIHGNRRKLCAKPIEHPRGSAEANAVIEAIRHHFSVYGIELREEDLSYRWPVRYSFRTGACR